MYALIWIAAVFTILKGSLALVVNEKSQRIVIVGAGASGVAAAAKLIENGYNDIVVLEAENRIGGRIHTIPFGRGFVDLGAQWCQGETGNVVYEMVKNHFEFGDAAIRHDNTHCYASDGQLVDNKNYNKLMALSETITFDYENMAKFNESFGEFFKINYRKKLQNEEFKDVDKELSDQFINLNEGGANLFFGTKSWFDLSSQLNAHPPNAEGNQLMTWKEHGSVVLFAFLMKKLPVPSKALPVEKKIHLNKEVTNINWTSNEVVVSCADGSEYKADHVIVTVSLGFLKKHHHTLFTPQLPAKKVNAIDNTGFGTFGKIFLEFEEPFWPTDVNTWAAYVLLWKKEDKDNLIGTDREWITEIIAFIREDAHPNLIGALLAGKQIKQFEEISDKQLIDGCMWLLEKFLGRTLPRPTDMRRSRWMSSKYFLGTRSYPSMDAQIHNVDKDDLGKTLYSDYNKPTVLFAGEATHNLYSGYVHGAVESGWSTANEILVYHHRKDYRSWYYAKRTSPRRVFKDYWQF